MTEINYDFSLETPVNPATPLAGMSVASTSLVAAQITEDGFASTGAVGNGSNNLAVWLINQAFSGDILHARATFAAATGKAVTYYTAGIAILGSDGLGYLAGVAINTATSRAASLVSLYQLNSSTRSRLMAPGEAILTPNSYLDVYYKKSTGELVIGVDGTSFTIHRTFTPLVSPKIGVASSGSDQAIKTISVNDTATSLPPTVVNFLSAVSGGINPGLNMSITMTSNNFTPIGGYAGGIPIEILSRSGQVTTFHYLSLDELQGQLLDSLFTDEINAATKKFLGRNTIVVNTGYSSGAKDGSAIGYGIQTSVFADYYLWNPVPPSPTTPTSNQIDYHYLVAGRTNLPDASVLYISASFSSDVGFDSVTRIMSSTTGISRAIFIRDGLDKILRKFIANFPGGGGILTSLTEVTDYFPSTYPCALNSLVFSHPMIYPGASGLASVNYGLMRVNGGAWVTSATITTGDSIDLCRVTSHKSCDKQMTTLSIPTASLSYTWTLYNDVVVNTHYEADITKTSSALMVDLITFTNPTLPHLDVTRLSFGVPVLSNDGTVGNTNIKATGVAGKGFSGTMYLNYDRLDLYDFKFRKPTELTFATTTPTFDELVEEFNSYYGCNLATADIDTTEAIPEIDVGTTYTLKANAGCLAYLGSITLSLLLS